MFGTILKGNTCHEPAGSPKGGQFCSQQLALDLVGGEGDAPPKRDPATYTESEFIEDLDMAESPKQVEEALSAAGARPILLGGNQLFVVNKFDYVVEWDGKDNYPIYKKKSDFLDEADPSDYFPDDDAEFNSSFWESPTYLYHNTQSEFVDTILRTGIKASSKSRGFTNRFEPDAVYTSTDFEEYEEGSYGSAQFQIDTKAMRRDNYTPVVAREPDIVESELKNRLATAIDAFDYYHEPDSSAGTSYNTVVVRGNIPKKYLTMIKKSEFFQAIFKANPYPTILKSNPCHEPAGSPIGGQFCSLSQVAYTQKDTVKAAKEYAKKIGAPEMVTTKAQLVREILKARDQMWQRMDPTKRYEIFEDSSDLPSKSLKEQKNAKWLVEEMSKWERKYEGKNPFDTPEVAQRIVQNAINYNYSLPKFRKVVDKFGEVPVVVMGFGKRTGRSPGASGLYEGGIVYLNSEWLASTAMEAREYNSFNEPPDDNRELSDKDVGYATGSPGLNSTHRHEYGHYVHSTAMPKNKAQEWDSLYTRVTGLPANASYEASNYGYDHRTPLITLSSYAQANSKEAFAEVFSVMTNPKFSRTQYPKQLDDLFDWMDKEVFS